MTETTCRTCSQSIYRVDGVWVGVADDDQFCYADAARTTPCTQNGDHAYHPCSDGDHTVPADHIPA